jgi:hypothetical protein
MIRLLSIAMTAACCCAAADSSILEEIRAHDKGPTVWWVYKAGWLIKADGLLIKI